MIETFALAVSRPAKRDVGDSAGGLIAGTLDLLQACVLFGWDIPLAIAAGLLGQTGVRRRRRNLYAGSFPALLYRLFGRRHLFPGQPQAAVSEGISARLRIVLRRRGRGLHALHRPAALRSALTRPLQIQRPDSRPAGSYGRGGLAHFVQHPAICFCSRAPISALMPIQNISGDPHAHGVQLVSRLGSFGRLRVSLDQRAQFANACIALALRQQRQSLVVCAAAALVLPLKPSSTAL